MSSPRETALAVIAGISGAEPATLTPETELVAELGIDSPKALKMLVEIEERLEIEIGDEEAARLATVGDVLDYVDRATA